MPGRSPRRDRSAQPLAEKHARRRVPAGQSHADSDDVQQRLNPSILGPEYLSSRGLCYQGSLVSCEPGRHLAAPRCSPFVRPPLILLIKMPGITFIAVGHPPQNCCCSRPTYRNPFRHPTILLRHVAFLIATIIDATKRYTALIITSNFQTGFNI